MRRTRQSLPPLYERDRLEKLWIVSHISAMFQQLGEFIALVIFQCLFYDAN
jgi:hypothetical protein